MSFCVLTAALLVLGVAGSHRLSNLMAAGRAVTEDPSDSLEAVRVSRWREDLAVLRRELPARHKNLFWRTPRTNFHRQLDSLDQHLPALGDAQIVSGMTRACAQADAHTGMGWGSGIVRFRWLPISLTRFEEGWFLLATGADANPALGTRLLAIDMVPIEQVVEALRPFVAHDNDQWLMDQLPEWISTPEMLRAAGVTRDTSRVVLSVEDSLGQRRDVEVRSLASADSVLWRTFRATVGTPPSLALSHRRSHYWSRWLPESRTMYVRYNQCVDVDTLPFRRFAAAVLDTIDSFRPGRVVVDLRGNGGGSSPLLRPLINGLRARRRPGPGSRVYALIGRGTYSSAVMNAHELRRRVGAVLVGEATGGAANHYGQVRSFVLPHSRIRVDYSTRYFRLVRTGDARWVSPDISVPLRWEDYRRGRDAALETVFSEHGYLSE